MRNSDGTYSHFLSAGFLKIFTTAIFRYLLRKKYKTILYSNHRSYFPVDIFLWGAESRSFLGAIVFIRDWLVRYWNPAQLLWDSATHLAENHFVTLWSLNLISGDRFNDQSELLSDQPSSTKIQQFNFCETRILTLQYLPRLVNTCGAFDVLVYHQSSLITKIMAAGWFCPGTFLKQSVHPTFGIYDWLKRRNIYPYPIELVPTLHIRHVTIHKEIHERRRAQMKGRQG